MKNQATKLPRGNALVNVDFSILSSIPTCMRNKASVDQNGSVTMVNHDLKKTNHIVG